MKKYPDLSDIAACSAVLSAQRFTIIFDFVAGGKRFQVKTLVDISLNADPVKRVVVTLKPETEQLIGYIIRTSRTATTMEASDADDGPLGTFPDRDSALDAILAAYLKRGADQ